MITSPRINNVNFVSKKLKLGELRYNDKYMVVVFNEGIDVNFDNFGEITDIIKSQYGTRPFGFISNRINSYSIDLSDANKFNKMFPNVKAYAVVAHNSITERIFEIEERFFTFNRKSFRNIDDAIDWVEFTLSTSK
ncbi:hypothetical protein [Winogradskyella poriferorum]|uniref:STAS/SEC14 domain-containing protein n=1 Tax=Winogradskyella poriferorum TaxID=307627 RepID=A0ABU7W4I1_9FLAO